MNELLQLIKKGVLTKEQIFDEMVSYNGTTYNDEFEDHFKRMYDID